MEQDAKDLILFIGFSAVFLKNLSGTHSHFTFLLNYGRNFSELEFKKQDSEQNSHQPSRKITPAKVA